jgi:hypothetical protein
MALSEVSTILWRERELLELLLFKLDEEQMVLTSGRTRWLARATREVEMVLAEIRRTEVERATEVDAAAEALGLGPAPSLNQLADASPEPWAGLLREHRAAFLALTAEISQLAEANRDLLVSGQRAAREALLSLGDEERTYTPTGEAAPTAPRPRLLDEAM